MIMLMYANYVISVMYVCFVWLECLKSVNPYPVTHIRKLGFRAIATVSSLQGPGQSICLPRTKASAWRREKGFPAQGHTPGVHPALAIFLYLDLTNSDLL